MEKIQLVFGVSVGGVLIALGSIIVATASNGIPLIVLGVVITAVTLFTYKFLPAEQSRQPALLPVPTKNSFEASSKP